MALISIVAIDAVASPPEKNTVSTDSPETDARIFLSSAIIHDNRYQLFHENISLPRRVQIESVINPASDHIGKEASLIFAVELRNEIFLIANDGRIIPYDGENLIAYKNIQLDSEIEETLLDIQLNESNAGYYKLYTGYQLLSEPETIVFNSEPAYLNLRAYWDYEDRQIWLGNQLEGQSSFCEKLAFRWRGVYSEFDINLDSKPDFLLPISCPQEFFNPTQWHNTKIQAQWKIFCSSSSNSHRDCTKDLFGDDFIDVTSDDPGGGHFNHDNLYAPSDLNGDGYPDFVFSLNRDDGRGLPNEEQQKLLPELCGPIAPEDNLGGSPPDCTFASKQSMFLSRGDGTYEIVPISSWGRVAVNSMHVFPNISGGHDIVGYHNNGVLAVRLEGRSLIDVSQEYSAYVNASAIQSLPHYSRVIHYEDKTYFFTPDVFEEFDTFPNTIEPDPMGRQVDGFTLWEFRPGDGFYMSDYYMPPSTSYRNIRFNDNGEETTEAAVIINDGIVFKPNWYFSSFTQLSPDEEPLLIVFNESDGGTTFGEYFKTSPNTNSTYYTYKNSFEEENLPYLVTNHLNPVQGFHINDGKIIERHKPVVEGGFVYRVTRMDFTDLNNDGYLDMLAVGGGPYNQVFLNDGNGTLSKLNTDSIWPFQIDSGGNDSRDNYGGHFFQANPDSTSLDLIYFNRGWFFHPNWEDPSVEAFNPGDLIILQGGEPIESLPLKTSEELQADLSTCIEAKQRLGSCYIF